MKMPEKHELLAAIRGKGTRHQQSRLQWRTFAADIMAVFTKISNRRNDVRHYRLVHSGPSRLRRTTAPRYITSVFIGYIGTDSIGSLIKRFAAGAGVEDGRNQ